MCQQPRAKAPGLVPGAATPKCGIRDHRPIDCGPAASHRAMAALDAPTLNLLPSGGLPARTCKAQLYTCKPLALRRPVECLIAHLFRVYHTSPRGATWCVK